MHRHLLSRLATAGLLALAAAGAGLAAAAPAAAVPGLGFHVAHSGFDSVAEKSATATCPAGTRVLGGGASITGADSHVHLTRLQPSGSFDTYVAVAVERAPYAGSWRVSAYAVCGDEPAGLEYVSFHTATDSDGYKTATATCPGTKKLVGLGARTLGGDGQVVLDDIMPSGTLGWVTVTAYEVQGGFAGDWSMWAYGVCADPLPGLELRTASGTPIDSTDEIVSVGCPAGKQVHGVGGMLSGGLGQVSFDGVYPLADLDSAAVVALEDPDGYANNWYSRVYAICAS
ncbi:MAG TPA: hypothetical protein VFM55_08895 [Micromonosporaceae bacterium]|nr:hypothetical protein [Micromonosporaceae bacterium]